MLAHLHVAAIDLEFFYAVQHAVAAQVVRNFSNTDSVWFYTLRYTFIYTMPCTSAL